MASAKGNGTHFPFFSLSFLAIKYSGILCIIVQSSPFLLIGIFIQFFFTVITCLTAYIIDSAALIWVTFMSWGPFNLQPSPFQGLKIASSPGNAFDLLMCTLVRLHITRQLVNYDFTNLTKPKWGHNV